MVDNTTKDSNTVRSSEFTDVYETVKVNLLRTVDEMAKAQPQYYQSISNLQLDYIQTIKNIIQTTISAQKQLAGNSWTVPQTAPYTDQFVKQSNEITNNTIRAVDVNNQLMINGLDALRENLKVYNRTMDTVNEFNNNIAKAWNLFFSVAQQQQRQFLSRI
jgi:hypothetical protein